MAKAVRGGGVRVQLPREDAIKRLKPQDKYTGPDGTQLEPAEKALKGLKVKHGIS